MFQLKSISICKLLRVALVLCLSALAAKTIGAQSSPTDLQENINGSDEHVSPVMGFNVSLDTTGQHNSATGWSQIVTPDISYRFNKHLSLSAGVPWYLHVNAFVPTKVGAATTYPLTSGTNLFGDSNLAAHIEASHENFNYLFVATVGFDTGNSQYGLSSKTTTYNFTNHFEYQFGRFIPDIELGEGDSTTLADQSVRRAYTAVGPLAAFQAGTVVELPWNINLELEAFEELPIGNQNVYGTVTRKGKKGKITTRQVLEGTGAAEDNGFNTELDVPIGSHLRLSGSYNRSLRQAVDTTSVGLTWTMRAPHLSHSH
jgi:hypothetical protein